MSMRAEDYGHKGGYLRGHASISPRAKLLSLQNLLADPSYKLKPPHLAALRAVVKNLKRTAAKDDRISRSKQNGQPDFFSLLNC